MYELVEEFSGEIGGEGRIALPDSSPNFKQDND